MENSKKWLMHNEYNLYKYKFLFHPPALALLTPSSVK